MLNNKTMQMPCTACGATNRLAAGDVEKDIRCGRCKADLLPPHPVALDDARWPAYMRASALPVVVDYWAPWCAPCRMMAPQFEQAAAAMSPRVRFIKIDTEANPRTAAAQGIRSIPTLGVYLGGREIARTSGAMSAADLQNWVTAVLAQHKE